MQKNKTKDMLVVGFALFAIFFGAGNLIFPSYLGAMSGNGWGISALGFLITDPVFPIIGVVATAMVGGMADDLGKRISRKFSVLIGTVSILTIGPFFAVPRTASTTHEIFTVQVFGNGDKDSISPWITSVVFFAVTLILVINPSKFIDIIGKFLTPVLILIIVVAIVMAIFKPAGNVVDTTSLLSKLNVDNLFKKGFSDGYQTMDALGSALMSGIVVTDLINKGYKEEKERFKMTCGVGIVAAILLAIVYGGLTYVGATVSDQFSSQVIADNKVAILVGIFGKMFGSVGKYAIGLAVTLACLTTSIGLVGTAGNFFTRVFHKEDDKNFYRIIVCICTGIAFFLSLFGVQKLILFAAPILLAIYPIYMVLFIITLFDKWVKYNWAYGGAVIVVALISIPSGITAAFGLQKMPSPEFLGNYMGFLSKLPLNDYGFNWLLPAICGFVIATIISAVGKVGKTRGDV